MNITLLFNLVRCVLCILYDINIRKGKIDGPFLKNYCGIENVKSLVGQFKVLFCFHNICPLLLTGQFPFSCDNYTLLCYVQ